MIRSWALSLSLLAAVASAAVSQALASASMTIYSHDLAFVRESRVLELGAGRDTVRLAGMPERLDVSSVRLVPAGKTRVRRLAYAFDLAQGDRIVERARGRRVRVALRGERTVEGTLLGSDATWIVVRTDDGGIETLARASVDEIRLPDPPRGLAFEPSLEVVLEPGASGRVPAELSYLTAGLSWSAEHTLLRTGERTGQWSTAVTIENTSGRSYDVPRLALVAGDPRREGPSPPPMPVLQMAMRAEKAADLGEQSFSEYHLYTLDRPALLRDRETQTLSMLEPRPVEITPRYLARPGAGVAAQLVVKNTRAGGLGVPLAAGRVRFYERDARGEEHFTGETRIRHTPEDETLTLDVGTAFDLVAERREVSNRRLSDHESEMQVEVKLRNRKKNAVTIVVEEPVAADHDVVRSSHPATRKDANTLQFTIPVPAGQEVALTYTVRVRF